MDKELTDSERQEVEKKQQEQLYDSFVRTLKNGSESISEYIKKGVDINKLTSDGVAPIFYATHDQLRELDEKLGDKVNWDIKDVQGRDIVMNAIDNYDYDTLKKVLQTAANVLKDTDNVDNEGKDAIMHAVEREDVSAILLLNRHDFNPNRIDNTGVTPAMRAVLLESPEAFDAVLKNIHFDFTVTDTEGKSLLDYVMNSKLPEFMNILAKTKFHNKRNILHYALENGNQQAFEKIISINLTDVNAQDNAGETPLMIAIKQNNLKAVQKLIDLGADVTLSNKNCISTLSYALQSDNEEIGRLILQKFSDLDINKPLIVETMRNNKKFCVAEHLPPLLIALEKDHIQLAEEIKAKGADINANYSVGMLLAPMIVRTAIWGEDKAFNFLYQSGAKLAPDLKKMFNEHADTNAVMLSYLSGKELDSTSEISVGRRKIMKQLIEDCRPSEKFLYYDKNNHKNITQVMTFWEYALQKGKSKEIVDFISKNDIDLDLRNQETGETLLMRLADAANGFHPYGYSTFVQLLKKRYKNHPEKLEEIWNAKNKRGENILLQACRHWSDTCLLDALPYVKDIDVCTSDGQTPLMLIIDSVKENLETQLKSMQAVLDRGANINLQDNCGNTALHKAINTGENMVAVVGLLLENDANPNIQNKIGNTPLMSVATRDNNYEAMEELLQYGADPNLTNNTGYCVLFFAISRHEVQNVKLLLEYNADPNIKSNDGKTPLDLALSSGNLEVIQLLLENGAKTDLVDNIIDKAIKMSVKFDNPEILNLVLDYKSDFTEKELKALERYQNQYGALKESLKKQSTNASHKLTTVSKIDDTKKSIKSKKQVQAPMASATMETPVMPQQDDPVSNDVPKFKKRGPRSL